MFFYLYGFILKYFVLMYIHTLYTNKLNFVDSEYHNSLILVSTNPDRLLENIILTYKILFKVTKH